MSELGLGGKKAKEGMVVMPFTVAKGGRVLSGKASKHSRGSAVGLNNNQFLVLVLVAVKCPYCEHKLLILRMSLGTRY